MTLSESGMCPRMAGERSGTFTTFTDGVSTVLKGTCDVNITVRLLHPTFTPFTQEVRRRAATGGVVRGEPPSGWMP
jgi:hypothetical protein